jgi:hypothetical protein
MRISAKEYIKQYRSGCEDYIMQFFGNREELVIEGGFLKWEQDASQWAGPWMGNFVLYVVSDFRQTRLPKEEELKTKYSEYVMANIDSYPQDVVSKCFTEDQFTCFVDGKKWIRTQLTLDERREIVANLSRQEVMDLSLSIRTQINHFNTVEILGDVCKERPFKLYLCGNNDTAYSKTFATKEEALSMLAKLEQTSSWDIIFNYFVFTK